MAALTFASKLNEDGSFTIPQEAVETLGLRPGDEITVRIETNGTAPLEAHDQATLQARFERFFENLDTLTFEKPVRFPAGDPAEAAFAEAMDEKYRKLGFKP
jgi:bifunctional DNA-binding transcriptional regulator/antitoxin component of YhaV-PrlF toxin-antitoxin module